MVYSFTKQPRGNTMKIDAVRKLAVKRTSELKLTPRQYAIHLKIEPNTMYLFLNGNGAYRKTVPKAVLEDLGLRTETVTTYHKKVVI